MVTVSMCMIVKNEADILKRCLDSYEGTYDELIIVDTGSTDDTKKIAAKYTDKIYDFDWIDDFAAARNYAFSLCSCDYIFSADADEELDVKNNNALRNLKSLLLPEIEIVQMYYVNEGDDNPVYNAKKELRPKLFKRLREFTWISPIHETVRLTPIVFDSEIEIMHKPVGKHNKRDFETFVKAINRGIRLEDYVVIMFCKELYISGSNEDFLRLAPLFLDILSLEDFRPEEVVDAINIILIKIARLKGDYDEFIRLIKEAACTDTLEAKNSEICIELGSYFESVDKPEDAVFWYKKAMCDVYPILDVKSGGVTALLGLGRSYESISNETEDATEKEKYKALSKKFFDSANNWVMPEE